MLKPEGMHNANGLSCMVNKQLQSYCANANSCGILMVGCVFIILPIQLTSDNSILPKHIDTKGDIFLLDMPVGFCISTVDVVIKMVPVAIFCIIIVWHCMFCVNIIFIIKSYSVVQIEK
jgi:hypothetical protein